MNAGGRAIAVFLALRRSTNSWKLTYALPLAVLFALSLPHLAQGDWRGDTGWYAALGLHGWRSGELLSLHAGSQPYFNKPPLALWIHGLFLHAGGVDVGIARLPTVLAAGLSVLATTGIASRLAGRSAGACAGVVLATSIEFFRRTREISLDIWQLAFLMLACWVVVAAVTSGRFWRVALAGIPIGLALLTKPIMGLAAVPMLAVWMLWAAHCDERWRSMRWLGVGVLIAAAVAMPWHLWMWRTHGTEFTAQYFGAEVGKRALGESVGGQKGQAWWFYVQQVVAAYWPWLLAATGAVVALARGRGDFRARGAMKFGIVWFVCWLVLLTAFPDRRDRYAVPMYPGLALMAGVWISSLSPAWVRLGWRGVRRWGLPVAAVGGVVFALIPINVQAGPDRQWREFGAWMSERRTRDGAWPTLYDGSFSGAPAARVFLLSGSWPIATVNRRGEAIAAPKAGDLVAYHRRGGSQPGDGERVEFSSGDLAVTRVEGAWSPRRVADPGE